MNAAPRFVSTTLICATLFAFSACVGATRMITRERGPSGEQLPKHALDLSFVNPGVTTRDEVVSKLSMVNTGYDDPHLFWGRWATSKWGYFAGVAGPYGGGAADANRIWHVYNLLITFDDRGVAQSKQLLDDDPQFWREVHKQTASLPPVDVTDAISFVVTGDGAQRITLAREWVEAERPTGAIRTVRIAPSKILRFRHAGPKDKRNSPGISCHVFYLSEKTAFGRKISFCTDGPNLLATFRYLHRYASPAMQWE